MQLQIECSAICNAACVFCPYPTMTRQRGTMDVDLFKKIIDEAAEIPLISMITITGLGEPLLDKHLFERLKYVRKKMPAIHLDLYTNGSYLTDAKIDEMIDAKVTVLYVSLNAANAVKRQQIMFPHNGTDDYDFVCQQARKAIEKGLKVVVKAVTSKDLMEHDERDQFKEAWGGFVDDGGNAFMHLEGNWAGATWPMRIKPTTACHRAISQIMVLWDGRVSLCCFDGEGEVTLGDLNRQTIREIYNGGKALEYRTAHMEGRRGEMPLCATCTAI